VFDPWANLRAASRVLDECHERALLVSPTLERAMAAALSCYNTGDFTRGVRNGYVSAVRAAANSQAPLAVAAEGARSQPERRSGSRHAARRRATSPEQRNIDAQPREEAFATAVADVFAASSREERAR
jgi:type IV secretion system protein VirB1